MQKRKEEEKVERSGEGYKEAENITKKVIVFHNTHILHITHTS
jgi:hypothetical protein